MSRSFYRNRLSLGAIPQERHVDRYIEPPDYHALLHFNGDAGSTTFTDESGKTWSTSANPPVLSTTAPKLGSASGLFASDTTEYITTADHADFHLGSNEFTIDFWMKWVTYQYGFIFANSNIWLHKNWGNIGFWWYNGSSWVSYYCGSNITTGEWTHVAVVRSVDTVNIYINGSKTGAGKSLGAGFTFNNTTNASYIGGYPSQGSYFNGYLDEFRFTNGLAAWTNNFTPPTTEYV